jgi:hypothetical protein
VATLVQVIIYNFYLVENTKIANNSTTVQAREKISTDSDSLEFYILNVCLANHGTIKIYLTKLATNFKQHTCYLLGEISQF